MSFNGLSIFFLATAFQGLFLTFALFSKKENRLPNRFLGGFLLLLSITLIEWVLWWTGGIHQLRQFMALSFAFPLLYGPFLFFYYETSFGKSSFKCSDALHFLPFLLGIFFMLPFYFRFIPSIHQNLLWIPPLAKMGWYPFFQFAQMIGYGFWINHLFKSKLNGDEETRWHRWILIAYLSIIVVYIVYRLTGVFDIDLKYLIAFVLTLFIYWMAWLGYIQPQIFNGIPFKDAIKPLKYRKSSLSTSDSVLMFTQIKDYLLQNKPYLDSSFSLDDLAQKLSSTRHHISQTINEQAQKSFTDFINDYRIEEAKQMLLSTSKQEKNVIEIAYVVGFGSKQSFNALFKKKTGMTPTEFRKNALNT